MSSTTPYLGLVLYDSSGDQAVTFATFRAVWGGPATTSNFYKIDTAVSNQASQISSLQLTKGAITVPALFVSANTYAATGVTNITAYNTGMTIVLNVDTTSNGTVTLNINSLGSKSVMKVDNSGTPINLTGSDLVKGRQYLFVYDGTRWLWVSANSADQISIVGTSGNVVTVNSDNTLLGTTTQAGLIADTTHAATSKSTPVDADEVPLVDSAASNGLKKLSWANIKATLKTYFDSLSTTLTNKNFSDSTSFFVNVSDATKKLVTSLGGATASKTMTIASSHTLDRTLTLPDATDTLVGKATTDVFTNKSLSDSTVSFVNVSDNTKKLVTSLGGATASKTMTIASSHTLDRTLTLPDATDTLVGKATTDTLTNKTLTTPIITSISNSGTVTIPSGTDTLVARTTTDTLTNKRITPRSGTTTSSATPTINTDNTDIFTITALATAITSFTTNLSGTPTEGQRLIIRILDNGTARAITWGASFASRGATLPTTTVISKYLYVGFLWNTVTSTWDCIATAQEA